MLIPNILFLENKTEPTKESIPLILGFFDVIHKGHLKLFNKAGKNFNVLSFVNVPSKQKTISNTRSRIMNLSLLNSIPKNIYIYDIQHNNNVSKFIEMLKQKINPSKIIVGDKFKFGTDRKYGIEELKKNFIVCAIKQNKISSSKIKQYIIESALCKANNLLVTPFYFYGEVISGKMKGRELGYRTANIELSKNIILPKEGSYAGYTFVNKKIYPSAVFLRDNLLETHLLNGFNEDIYGKKIFVFPLFYTKKINKAESCIELRKIITQKVKEIEKILHNLKCNVNKFC